MPRETLRALDADIERIVLAGGALAASDEGLAARKSALAQFAPTVPALAKVAEQVGRTLGLAPRACTTELMNLAAMSAQLRGAQAAPGRTAGEVRPMEPAVVLDTPLAWWEVDGVLDALGRKGAGRTAAVTDAIERGAVRDLRLLGPWVAALEDTTVADLVAEKVLPVYGEAASTMVARAFRLDGNAVDARRLSVLVAIRGRDARALVDEAVARGSPHVRAAGVTALAKLDPEAAEPVALELLASDKSREVRAAAALALSGRSNKVVLEALLAALDSAQEVRTAAALALGTLAHPETTKRLLALLTPESLKVKDFKPARRKRGARLTPAQIKAAHKAQTAGYREVAEKVAYLGLLMSMLGARGDAKADKLLLSVWEKHKMFAVRRAAGVGLLNSPNPAVLATLADSLGKSGHWQMQHIAKQAYFKDTATIFERTEKLLTPQRLAKPASLKIACVVLQEIVNTGHAAADPRLVALAAKHLKSADLAAYAIAVIASAGDRTHADAVAKLFPTVKVVRYFVLSHIQKLATPAIAEAVAAVLGKPGWPSYQVLVALDLMDEPNAAPAVRKYFEKLEKNAKRSKRKSYKDYQLEQARKVLARLERAR